jgi:hypothetical protein
MELFNDEVDDLEEEIVEDVRFTREELRNVRSRLRSQINRDSANSEKRAVNAARDIISMSELYNNPEYRKNLARTRTTNAIAYSAANLASKVLSSMGLKLPVRVETFNATDKPSVMAYTTFKDIHIRLNLSGYDENNLDNMVRLLNNVKGIVYHEGGHVLFTHMFYQIYKTVHQARGVSFNEYGVKHATHKFDGEVLQWGVDNGLLSQDAVKNLMLTNANIDYVMRAWNILEDQRMETAMVTLSPVMARYFTEIVLGNVIIPGRENLSWPWLVGRTYLPKEIRSVMRELALTRVQGALIPAMEEIIMQYRRSNDVFEMYDLSVKFAEYLIVWQNDGRDSARDPGEHGASSSYIPTDDPRSGSPSPVPIPDDGAQQPKDAPDIKEGHGDKNNEEPNDESEGEGEDGEKTSNRGDKGAKPSDDKPIANRNTNQHLRELIDEALKRTPTETNQMEVNEFLSDVNEAKQSLVIPDRTVEPMTSDEITQSIAVANSMRDVLDKLVVQVDPSWVFYQENGVLDPVAFDMREPGDTNYWSGLNGDGGTGHDLAVTLALDTSGSMGGFDTELSVAAMGIRKACEQLDIPCSILTFNDDVAMVVEGDKDIDYVRVSACGGTSVASTMNVISNFRYGKTHHLVVILTDGEWSDIKDLRAWSSPGRHIMLVGFNIAEHYLSNKGADSRAVITNLSELPMKVTHALAGYFM